MTQVIQIIVDGIVIGSTYALVGVGFTLVFGVLRLLNVAHAEFYMLGAFVSLWVTDSGAGPIASVFAAVLVGMAAGVILYLVVLKRLTRADMTSIFIATLGVSFFIEYLVARTVGSQTRPAPGLFHSSFVSIAGIAISSTQLVLLGVMAAVTLGLVVWIGRTELGRDMRAIAENQFLAAAVGVRVGVVMAMAIAVASGIAALGGVLIANTTNTVSPFMGDNIALKMFVVVMVAGAGSVGGAALAGIGLGIAESFAVAYIGSGWQDAVGLFVLIAILLFRPQGLFGRAARVG